MSLGASPNGPHVNPGSGPHADLDQVALAKLRELDPDGRRGVVRRVLTAFESSLSRWLQQLQGHPDPVDAGVLGSIAHTLKSSAGSVGAKDLSLACADVERRLRNGEVVDVPLEVARLLSLGQAALLAVRAMLPN